MAITAGQIKRWLLWLVGVYVIGVCGCWVYVVGTEQQHQPPWVAERESARQSAAALKFFVRPQFDGIRLTNDGSDSWRLCTGAIAGHEAQLFSFAPGESKTIAYREFDGLIPDEGFTRARAGFHLHCVDAGSDNAADADYGGHP